ncbi:MAG: molybdate ABC transporter substrate-binding protein [Gammaproteobacteria bacterium]
MKLTIKLKPFLLISALLFFSMQTYADNLNVAVASNFSRTLQLLAKDFESKNNHRLLISSASTGKLYTQINHGAPFDIFLAADEHRPNLLIEEGKARANMSAVYATGNLIFISHINPETSCQNALNSPALKRLAIANPKTAPYGLAAQQTLDKLRLWKTIKAKLVMGENIAQSLQFVSTGNAQAGFVAKSMLLQGTKVNTACEWKVPAEMHEPINQKMLVLASASNKPAAKAFWQYMQSDDAKTIIKNSGYDVP